MSTEAERKKRRDYARMRRARERKAAGLPPANPKRGNPAWGNSESGTGKSGNPKGQPPKAQSLSNLLIEYGELPFNDNKKIKNKEQLTKVVWGMALKGDPTIIKFLYERAEGKAKERIDTDTVHSLADAFRFGASRVNGHES